MLPKAGKFILLLMLLFPCFVSAETKDTTRMPIQISLDNKQQVIHGIYRSYEISNFDSLVIFFDGYVDFYFKLDTTLYHENVTDYGVVEKLNDFFKNLPYQYIKLGSSKTKAGEDVILVQVFWEDSGQIYKSETYFVLNKNGSIKSVWIL